jgi:hypothetical protein
LELSEKRHFDRPTKPFRETELDAQPACSVTTLGMLLHAGKPLANSASWAFAPLAEGKKPSSLRQTYRKNH